MAEAVVQAFTPEIERALSQPADFKSALQERLARRGTTVSYDVISEEGPPHERWFEVAANVGGEALGRGSGRSKKDAEQAAAEAALDSLSAGGSDAPELDHAAWLQVDPTPHTSDVLTRRVGVRGPAVAQ